MADRNVRPFSDFIHDQRNGVLALEISEGLNKLVESVETTGKQGSITLKLTVKPSGKDTQGAVLVSDLLTLKLPESHPEHFFFVDPDCNLTRANPGQLGYDGELLEVPERVSGELKEPRS